jgi:hypothetical protein
MGSVLWQAWSLSPVSPLSWLKILFRPREPSEKRRRQLFWRLGIQFQPSALIQLGFIELD